MSNPQFRTAPSYDQPVMTADKTTSVWYRYFQASETGQPPDNESGVPLMTSPMLFVASRKGFVIITGGTVSAIAISRTPNVFYPTGQLTGAFTLAQGDTLRLTYTGTPTVTFFPT
jgi:hypothetical protein